MMKRFGMLLVLFSVSLFALGCSQPADTPPAGDETPVVTEGAEGAAAEMPAAEGEDAAEEAEEK